MADAERAGISANASITKIIVLVGTLTLFVIVVLITLILFTQGGVHNLNENLEYWMTQLPSTLRELSIVQLAIPGSHNSMTYTITKNNDIGPDLPDEIRRLGWLAKVIIFNWTVNQNKTIKEQLNGGIRYLDLRVATKDNDNKIYFLHGLYGAEISQPLQDIAEWLQTHSNETVIMDFQHFYNFNETHHNNLINQVKNIFRDKMCPKYDNFDNITLEWLNSKKYQIFIIYRNDIVQNYNNLWPSELWPTPWPNTIDPVKLVNFLDEGLQNRTQQYGYISQCLLTPDRNYIFMNICGNLYTNLFPKYHSAALKWIEEHSPGNGGMNIVITDFISSDDYLFSKNVIKRNTVLLELNSHKN